MATLALTTYAATDEERARQGNAPSREGPFILACPYCSWSSLEIGITFDKSINISGQLAKMRNGGQIQETARERAMTGTLADSNNNELQLSSREVAENQFSNLATFYKNQIAESTPSGLAGTNSSYGLDSPGHLTRLLSTYGVGGLKKQKGKPAAMREALTESEGLILDSIDDDEIIERMRTIGWSGMTDADQRQRQNNGARFFSDVRPQATLLRSKRAKRCRTCRNSLIRLEDKRQSTRYKIRLVAVNYLPRVTVKALDPNLNYSSLKPLKPTQFLLTFRNPLFEPVKITLATSPSTEGNVSSKVTLLCPQFDIGASTDAWHDALVPETKDKGGTKDGFATDKQQAEAGKTWQEGRNWTTVILEIVPDRQLKTAKSSGEKDESESITVEDRKLEVAILVRMEYDTDETSADPYAEGSASKVSKDKKVRKELAYWIVLGLGQIGQLGL